MHPDLLENNNFSNQNRQLKIYLMKNSKIVLNNLNNQIKKNKQKKSKKKKKQQKKSKSKKKKKKVIIQSNFKTQ